MPIVLSYTDVEALGSLAFQAGQAPGRARAQQQAADRALAASEINARLGLQREQLRAEQQQAQADRAFRGQQAQLERDFIRGRDATAFARESELMDHRNAAALQEAAIQADLRRDLAEQEAAGSVAEALLEADLQRQRDERLHAQRLSQIDREAAYGKYDRSRGTGADAGGFLSPQGVPDEDLAKSESQRFGHLIPYGVDRAVSGDQAARERKRASETAVGLAQLPTAQIESYLAQNPDDRWAPYLRAIVESRRATQLGQPPVGPRQSVMAEGRRLPSSPSQGFGGAAATGFGDGRLHGLSDADLHMLANNPELLQRFLSQ